MNLFRHCRDCFKNFETVIFIRRQPLRCGAGERCFVFREQNIGLTFQFCENSRFSRGCHPSVFTESLNNSVTLQGTLEASARDSSWPVNWMGKGLRVAAQYVGPTRHRSWFHSSQRPSHRQRQTEKGRTRESDTRLWSRSQHWGIRRREDFFGIFDRYPHFILLIDILTIPLAISDLKAPNFNNRKCVLHFEKPYFNLHIWKPITVMCTYED